MFKLACSHLKSSPKAVILYSGLIVLYAVIKVYGESIYLPDKKEMDLDDFPKNYLLLSGIITAIYFAIAQAIAFPIFGREIDKPLWKIPPTLVNFFKFFSFWFALHLLSLMLRLLIFQSDLVFEEQFNLYMTWLMFTTTILPLGATVMFYGDTSWTGIKQSLTTMFGQFPYYLGVCIITFFIYIYIHEIYPSLPNYALPIIELIGALIDCIIFAYCWEVCKKHRDELENMDDLDF